MAYTPFNTGNPIGTWGSVDPRDLVDNAAILDRWVNDRTITQWRDRFGVQRLTWNGMEVDFQQAQTNRQTSFDAAQMQHQTDFDSAQADRDGEFSAAQAQRDAEFKQFLLSSGYQFLGDYDTDGPLTITEVNQIFSKDGEFWRASAALSLPYTTVDDWVADEPKFVSVGDAVLRQDLANPSSVTAGASLIARGWQAVGSISELRALLKTSPSKWVDVAGYYAPGDGGGGMYYLDVADVTSLDNGVTVIVATDGGRWKLNHRGTVTNKQCGCVADGITDDTARVQAGINAVGSIGFLRGWTLVTQTLTLPSSNKLELYGNEASSGLKVSLPNDAYLIDNTAQAADDTRIHVHDLEFNYTNVNANGFKITSTILPVIFENLYFQNANNVFDFSDLFANPTIRNVTLRSLNTGRPDAFVLQCNNVNTLLVDGLSATGNWGFGIQLYDESGANNYSNRFINVTMQGTSGNQIGRSFYSRGGTLQVDSFYTEFSSIVDTVYLDGVLVADIGQIHMTKGSIYAKNSNVMLSAPSFLTISGDVSQLVSENSNITIGSFFNLNDYQFRFERRSSGRIKVGAGNQSNSGSHYLGALVTGANFGASTVTNNTALQSAGLKNAIDIAVSGQSAGFNNGVTLALPNTSELPVGTPLTVIVRVNKKSGNGVRIQTVGSDFTAVYPIPVTSIQTLNGWFDLVMHLKSVATGNNGNVRVVLDGDGVVTAAGALYIGWISP